MNSTAKAKRTKIYIASPLTGSGDREANIAIQVKAGTDLMQAGFSPFMPNLSGLAFTDHDFPHSTWMEVDLAWVGVADALLRLPGLSSGADMEEAEAHRLHIPVYYSVEEVISHVRPNNWGHPGFLDAIQEAAILHRKKSLDYGTTDDHFANVRASEDFGIPAWLGTMIRAHDKVIRLKSYAKNGKLANESVQDSLIDLAAYALISLVLFRESAESKLTGQTSSPTIAPERTDQTGMASNANECNEFEYNSVPMQPVKTLRCKYELADKNSISIKQGDGHG